MTTYLHEHEKRAVQSGKMDRNDATIVRKAPLVQGGQGRSDQEVEQHAKCFASTISGLALGISFCCAVFVILSSLNLI